MVLALPGKGTPDHCDTFYNTLWCVWTYTVSGVIPGLVCSMLYPLLCPVITLDECQITFIYIAPWMKTLDESKYNQTSTSGVFLMLFKCCQLCMAEIPGLVVKHLSITPRWAVASPTINHAQEFLFLLFSMLCKAISLDNHIPWRVFSSLKQLLVCFECGLFYFVW